MGPYAAEIDLLNSGPLGDILHSILHFHFTTTSLVATTYIWPHPPTGINWYLLKTKENFQFHK